MHKRLSGRPIPRLQFSAGTSPRYQEIASNYSFENIEDDTTNNFLRKANFPSSDLCKICHTEDAIFRYRYFHIPGKRGGKKKVQEKVKFRRF